MKIDSTIDEVTKDDLHDRNDLTVISTEDAEKADSLFDKIEKFLEDNKEAGKSNDEDVKTKLYGEVKGIWKELSNHINNIGFIFNVNDDEYKLLRSYIFNKCEYDHQSVFMGVQLKEDFFKRAEIHRKENEPILITCNETVLLHHLLENGGMSVKGLDTKAYNLRNILTAIGNINKHYNELDVASKRAGGEINDWVQGLEKEGEQQNEESTAETA